MTYVKNISNWPDPGGQIKDMSQNYSLLPDNSDFPGKTKNNRSTQICLNYSLRTSLLSILMIDVTYQIGLIQSAKIGYEPKLFTFTA